MASLLARQLRDLSALTNLPGSHRVSIELSKLVSNPANKYAVFNVEIDGFKSINDRYGSGRGDKVIKWLGSLLSEIMATVTEKPSLLAHIGGARFVIISAPENVDSLCETIIEKFDEKLEYYDEEAREVGFVEVTNRKSEIISCQFVN